MTETVAATDPKLTVTVLSYLKHLGIGVILDDFGTGNSSLSGLRQFPVEALKIDRSLVSGMLADRGTRDTVELIILLAHKLKLKVIAEGIETAKHLERLRDFGCDLGQGYFFSPPLRAGSGEQTLARAHLASHAKGDRSVTGKVLGAHTTFSFDSPLFLHNVYTHLSGRHRCSIQPPGTCVARVGPSRSGDWRRPLCPRPDASFISIRSGISMKAASWIGGCTGGIRMVKS